MSRSLLRRPFPRTRVALLVLVLVTVLAACGGGPTQDADLAGSWSGTWVSDQNATGGVTATFTQAAGVLNGTVEITGSPCIANGTIEGTVTGNNVAFGVVSGVDTINYSAQLSADTMTGTYSIAAGACAGTGTFQMNRIN